MGDGACWLVKRLVLGCTVSMPLQHENKPQQTRGRNVWPIYMLCDGSITDEHVTNHAFINVSIMVSLSEKLTYPSCITNCRKAIGQS